VVDEYGLLSSGESGRLASLLRAAKQNSGVEIAVYIPSTLRGREIEDFSIAVAEEWKLGRKKEDKALLFVIAPKERKMRIEVAYGIEGLVTDAFSRQLLDNVMRPYFRDGRYYQGILATLVKLQEKVPLGLDGEQAAAEQRADREAPPGVFLLLFILFIIGFLVITSFFRRAGLGGYDGGFGGGGGWGGGSRGSGGSSWGGGGGGFGGGGSSSSW
jgi:uncharacterized protein